MSLGPRGLAALQRFACAAVRPSGAAEPAAVRRAALRARAAEVPRRALEETALMLVVYAGFPAALEAFRALERAWPGRPRAARTGSPATWRRRGARLCRRVYGAAYPRLIAHVRAMHPDLAVWMVETGYGRVLSRPGLAARERELVAVAVLAATGWKRQLVSHLLGAAHVGAERRAIAAAVAVGLAAGGDRTTAARALAAAAAHEAARSRV